MDETIIRYLQGLATPAEVRQLEEWRRGDAENERYFRELQRVWWLTGKADHTPQLPQAPTARELLAGRVGGRDAAGAGRRRLLPVAVAAACLILGFAVARFSAGRNQPSLFAAAEFVTGATETATTQLSDGTIVRLAPRSRLQTFANDKRREVWLEGRAFFAVAKDESRPFIVRTRAGDARVLGTRFEVLVGDEDMRVAVVEGRVALSSGGESREVAAGEVSEVAVGQVPSVRQAPELDRLIDWIGDLLIFEDTPLAEVTRKLEERYGIHATIADSALAERTVTAWFVDQSAEEIVRLVCRVVNAQCTVQGGDVQIEPRENEE